MFKNLFKIFNKKEEPKKEAKKQKPTRPWNAEDNKPNLQALYNCSIQKKATDFMIQAYSMGGAIVNVAIDSIEGYDVKKLNATYEKNMQGQEIIFTHYATKGFIGFNNCSILAQDWLIMKACALPCKDAISIDYNLILCDDEITDEDKDIIAKLKALSKSKYKVNKICQKFATKKRIYGQALAIPLVDDADYSIPFNIDSITPKSYKGMVYIEPIWVSPVLDIEAITNPLSERYYQPTWFRLPNGQLIHHTWFIFNTYDELADILKPTYYFGGTPLPQLLYEQVFSADKTSKEAPMLAQSKRLNYVEANLNSFLADQNKMAKEVNLMSWLRNNWGWLLVKKDQRIGQLDTSLTDFDAVVMLGFQIVAAISGVQSARLLETSPKGWQSSGSLEDKNYSKLQKSIQKEDFCPILEMHYKLLAKSEFNIIKNYTCRFDEIDNPSELERAQIREINSRTDMNYVQAGVVSTEEIRSNLKEDENSGYVALSDEEIEEQDPFADIIGGSSNEQDLFNIDKWNESDRPRKDNRQFGKCERRY